MKRSDIDRIFDAGLITAGQRAAIVAHFGLGRESNKLMAILSIVGAILVSSGIILLVASNWDSIPRWIKLAGGLALLGGMHAGGWVLGRSGRHPYVAETLHMLGAGMFLANIALVGQIYHLGSRPPDAFLLWLVGIAPLPWLLRSKVQHVLTLAVLALWLGLEMSQQDSVLYFGGELRQVMFYAIIGLLFAGVGVALLRSGVPEFGPPTEKFGLLMFYIASYPTTIGEFYGVERVAPRGWMLSAVVSLAALALMSANAARSEAIADRRWRWTWMLAQAGILGLAWLGLTVHQDAYSYENRLTGPHWVALPALFIFAVLQVQVGLIRRAPWFVNAAMVFIGLYILTAYFVLFGSMQTTGMMFVVTGVFLIGLSMYLERRRRSLLALMRELPPSTT
jgi:uncharacterized membrane protein